MVMTRREFIEKIKKVEIRSGGDFADGLILTAYDENRICLVSGKEEKEVYIDDGSYAPIEESIYFDQSLLFALDSKHYDALHAAYVDSEIDKMNKNKKGNKE